METEFKAGDHVRIKSGPFASFPGRVESVSGEGLLLRVVVEIFGRATPLDLMFCDVEKIEPPDERGPLYTNN
jgi:transcription termination/antitermination protein NusG